ncbi:hypothetical protein KP509_34G063800 [Ceratopteris richardii]|uniref:Secreted protein n=1 Tax=Ceratopteris richardii TaxID=49495 RepID=A0A8T2QLU9_CERRI|nr:hypothetical protein KP509_34G063800 [Ceratopteris richardii]
MTVFCFFLSIYNLLFTSLTQSVAGLHVFCMVKFSSQNIFNDVSSPLFSCCLMVMKHHVLVCVSRCLRFGILEWLVIFLNSSQFPSHAIINTLIDFLCYSLDHNSNSQAEGGVV